MASPEFVQDAACLQTFNGPLRIYVSIPEPPLRVVTLLWRP